MIKFVLAFAMLVTFHVSATAGEITVAAGAGLKDVLDDVAAAFVQRNQSIRITKNMVVSGVLAKQLHSGAQVDVVFVANREWMDYLKEKSLWILILSPPLLTTLWSLWAKARHVFRVSTN